MEDNTTYPEFISFTAGIPPIPEDEFCVHGIVRNPLTLPLPLSNRLSPHLTLPPQLSFFTPLTSINPRPPPSLPPSKPPNNIPTQAPTYSLPLIINIHGVRKIYANPTKSDALEKIYAETTRLAATEPGMLHYSVARDPDNRDAFHFYERYAGRAAFEAHNGQPIIVRLLNDEEKLVRGVRFKFIRAIRAAEVKLMRSSKDWEIMHLLILLVVVVTSLQQ
ncbi:hypothetical protein V8F06_004436 [Rhypophila decipiens]